MALTAVTNEEVSGKESRELTDAEVLSVLTKEAKKRRESVDAYMQANRKDLADKESAELSVLEKYLPAALSDSGRYIPRRPSSTPSLYRACGIKKP